MINGLTRDLPDVMDITPNQTVSFLAQQANNLARGEREALTRQIDADLLSMVPASKRAKWTTFVDKLSDLPGSLTPYIDNRLAAMDTDGSVARALEPPKPEELTARIHHSTDAVNIRRDVYADQLTARIHHSLASLADSFIIPDSWYAPPASVATQPIDVKPPQKLLASAKYVAPVEKDPWEGFAFGDPNGSDIITDFHHIK